MTSIEEPALHSLLAELARERGKLAGPASLAVLERTLERDEMPPLHAHEEPEAFVVLDGCLLVLAGDEAVRLEAGEAFVARAGVPHTYRARSTSARYLAASFVRSPEQYAGFLRAVAQPVRATGDTEPAEDERVVATLAQANRITLLGPPGALPASALAA